MGLRPRRARPMPLANNTQFADAGIGNPLVAMLGLQARKTLVNVSYKTKVFTKSQYFGVIGKQLVKIPVQYFIPVDDR